MNHLEKETFEIDLASNEKQIKCNNNTDPLLVNPFASPTNTVLTLLGQVCATNHNAFIDCIRPRHEYTKNEVNIDFVVSSLYSPRPAHEWPLNAFLPQAGECDRCNSERRSMEYLPSVNAPRTVTFNRPGDTPVTITDPETPPFHLFLRCPRCPLPTSGKVPGALRFGYEASRTKK